MTPWIGIRYSGVVHLDIERNDHVGQLRGLRIVYLNHVVSSIREEFFTALILYLQYAPALLEVVSYNT